MRNNWAIEELILTNIGLILKIKMEYFLRLRLNNFFYFLNALHLVTYLMIYLELWVV